MHVTSAHRQIRVCWKMHNTLREPEAYLGYLSVYVFACIEKKNEDLGSLELIIGKSNGGCSGERGHLRSAVSSYFFFCIQWSQVDKASIDDISSRCMNMPISKDDNDD